MALTAKSLIVFSLEVTTLNRNINFKIAAMGSELTATLNLGFYSPTGLAAEVERALASEDGTNSYTVTVTRNILGGLQNRFTVATSGAFLSLLFLTGTDMNTSAATLIGFNPVDYTGSTGYTGSTTVGTGLLTTQIGYNYLDDYNQTKVFGAVNVSASGLKESVTFNFQKFIDIQFKYEPASRLSEWRTFFLWAIQQRPFDFTPEITEPETFYQVTLEKTDYDSKGLGYRMKEMLPNFPNFYDTGMLMFRITEEASDFI